MDGRRSMRHGSSMSDTDSRATDSQGSNSATGRSRLAFLGTVGELHRGPLQYDLHTLQATIAQVSPDLLCAEITPEQWEARDLESAILEVREGVWPVSAASDVVVVPVAPSPERFQDLFPDDGWPRKLAERFDRLLTLGIYTASTTEALNGLIFNTLCHTICELNTMTWTEANRSRWDWQTEVMASNIERAVRRDHGRRILVVVQCQRVHSLALHLGKLLEDVEIVPYVEL